MLLAADERVRKALNEVLGALMILADEVASARRTDDWNRRDPDVDGAGRHVLVVSEALASALVDLLPEFELEYGELDEVFDSIAARWPESELVEAAASVAKLFEALREISYDAIDAETFPDAEDANAAVERFVEFVLERHETV